MGPLFFIIYINDIFGCSGFKITLFADDAYLSITGKDANLIEHRANRELMKVNDWLKFNRLSLNVEKSTFMLFTKSKQNKEIKLQVGKNNLKSSDVVKYLGILIDKNITWKNQIAKVESKIASACWAMSKIKRLVNSETLKTIYYATVYPHMVYCISSWGGVPPTRRNHLIVLQKRAIRIISKVGYREHTSDLFHNLNLLKQPDIYKLRLLTIMHKINNGTWIGNIGLQKIDSLHQYSTRLSSNQNYRLPSFPTNRGMNSFVYMGPTFWAEYPNEIKTLPLQSFKKTITKIMVEEYLVSN